MKQLDAVAARAESRCGLVGSVIWPARRRIVGVALGVCAAALLVVASASASAVARSAVRAGPVTRDRVTWRSVTR